MKFKEKLQRFFYGRYGVDQLYKFLMAVWFILMIASFILQIFQSTALVGQILSMLSLILVIYMFFRVFSKNIVARQIENTRYLTLRNKVTGWFSLQKRRFKERKTHSFKKCPGCKKTVRLKKIKGEHTVRCPLCSCTFKVKF